MFLGTSLLSYPTISRSAQYSHHTVGVVQAASLAIEVHSVILATPALVSECSVLFAAAMPHAPRFEGVARQATSMWATPRHADTHS